MKILRVAKSVIPVALIAISGVASANLLFGGPNTLGGTGLGAVNTLTTVHDPGGSGDNNGTESGCVEFNGTTTVQSLCHFLAGEQGGDNQAINQTFTLAQLGAQAGQLALIVNIAETGQDQAATLTGLYLALNNGTSNDYFYYVGPPLVLTQANQAPNGTGQAGYLFFLDATQAAAANAFCAGHTCTVGGGLQFLAGSTDDGNETMFVTSLPQGPPTQAPEPGTLSLMGLALFAGVFVLRKRMQARA